MLKTFAALAISFTALTATQSAKAQTGFLIYPERPIYCQLENAPMVNRVTNVQKLHEDEKTASFTFKTSIGACSEGAFILRSEIGNAIVQTFKNKIVLFGKEAVKSQIEVLNATEAQIKLTFDKKATFKKKDVVGFTMMFYPNWRAPIVRTDAWGRTYYWHYQNYYFPWQVRVSKLADGQSDLEVGVGRLP